MLASSLAASTPPLVVAPNATFWHLVLSRCVQETDSYHHPAAWKQCAGSAQNPPYPELSHPAVPPVKMCIRDSFLAEPIADFLAVLVTVLMFTFRFRKILAGLRLNSAAANPAEKA